ncbi:hypothetical protein AA19596_1915 [Acetobacter fabarum DSM 19596]|nr:hypothetical protein AA19596_1915 [Acetobacter fabarum DSM 19596]
MGEVLAAPARRILNMKEAAAYLGMSVTTFRECVAPKVQSIKLMPSRVSYDVDELNKFIDRASGRAPAPTEKQFWDQYR